MTQNTLSLTQIKKASNEWFRFGEGYVSTKNFQLQVAWRYDLLKKSSQISEAFKGISLKKKQN